MHAETLRDPWSSKTTVCRVFSWTLSSATALSRRCSLGPLKPPARSLKNKADADAAADRLSGTTHRSFARIAQAKVRPQADKYAGGHRIRVTPVPIPNTEVKPDTADGTVWETVWESRSLPALITAARELRFAGCCFFTVAALRRHTVSHTGWALFLS